MVSGRSQARDDEQRSRQSIHWPRIDRDTEGCGYNDIDGRERPLN